MHLASLAASFIIGSPHSWSAFALGALVAYVLFFLIPKLRERRKR